MKRSLTTLLVALVLLLAFGTSASAAEQAPDCVYVTAGEGVDLTSCSPGDGMPPPHIVVERLDGSIAQPTQ